MPEGLPFAVSLGQVYMVSVLLLIFLVSGQLNKEDGDDCLVSKCHFSKSFHTLLFIFPLKQRTFCKNFELEILVRYISISVNLLYYHQRKSNLLKLLLFSKIQVQ